MTVQWKRQHVFDGAVHAVCLIVLAAATCAPHRQPVRRPVARAAEPLRIHKGFQQDRLDDRRCAPSRHSAAPSCVQVGATPGAGFAPTAKSRNGCYRRRNGYSGAALRCTSRCSGRGCRYVAGPNTMPSRPRAGPGPHQVLEMFAHRLFIAEVMMMLHQAVEQRLMGGATHWLRTRSGPGPSACLRSVSGQVALAPDEHGKQAGCGVCKLPAATRSGRHGATSTVARGRSCRAGCRWAGATPMLRTASWTASAGSRPDVLRSVPG